MRIYELIIDAYGCNPKLINNEKFLLKIIENSAKSVNAKVIKKNVYKYKPRGVSIVLFLAESYISIYTWPEFKYATIGIFLCNEKIDPFKVWCLIRKELKPRKIKLKKILHIIKNYS